MRDIEPFTHIFGLTIRQAIKDYQKEDKDSLLYENAEYYLFSDRGLALELATMGRVGLLKGLSLSYIREKALDCSGWLDEKVVEVAKRKKYKKRKV